MVNLTLKPLLAILPLVGRKKGLTDLFRMTAEALGQEPPSLRGLTCGEILLDYARFTCAEAEKSLAKEAASAVRERLHARSARLGLEIRSRLPIRNRSDAAAALRCLYRLLSIEMKFDTLGAVTIRRCFFAAHYPSEVCRFMSAMDEGIVAGLCGGRLVFTQRLTEGADRCNARIEWPGENE